MEPAAMLVVPFEIDLARPVELGALAQHGDVRAAGVEPDVEDVALFPERRAAALRAALSGLEEVLRRPLVPGVGTLVQEVLLYFLEELGRGDGLIALVAIENGDRHAPEPLARDAPVGAVGDHAGDAVLAPGGVPG